MWACIISCLQSIFARKEVGILARLFAENAAKELSSQILDPENQRRAYEFVRELHDNTEMSGLEKAKAFNLKMAKWAATCGKKLASSALNCLRELAVNALKDELGTKL